MKRSLILGFTTAAVTAAAALPALAAWDVTTAAGSTGRASATVLQPAAAVGAAPKSGATSSAITVSWSAPTTGLLPTGYVVRRTAPNAVTVCTVPATTLSCDDSGLTPSTAYSYTVTSTRVNWNGTAQTAGSSTVSADTTAPVTTATPSGTAGENGYHTTNVSVALSASDGGTAPSGVQEIVHSATGVTTIGTTTTPGASASASFATEGTSTLSYGAKDRAGNIETTKSLTVKIDKTRPVVSITSRTTKNGNGNAAKGTIAGAMGALAEVAGSSTVPGSSADAGTVSVQIFAGTATSGTPVGTVGVIMYNTTAKTYTVDYDGLTSGSSYTAVVTQRDAAGNVGQATQGFTQ